MTSSPPSSNRKSDPWTRMGRENEVTSYVNEFAENFDDHEGGSHDDNRYFLCCYKVSTRNYQRMSVDENKEESRYLIDNDELELSQQRQQQRHENEPSNGTIDKTFADNFV